MPHLIAPWVTFCLAAPLLALTLQAQVAPPTATAPLAKDRVAALDEVAAKLDARLGEGAHPGAALAVFRRGELLWFRGVGQAQLENEIPISRKSTFRLASTSKQFTAAAIALLASRGELDLDADVHTWFPDLPDFGTPVTLRHLVHHTSGLRDYLRLHYFEGLTDEEAISPKRSFEIIERQRSLAFAPGTRYDYSNTNYLMLAEIVARVSKRSFADFVTQEIFEPLGMKTARVSDDRNAVIPFRTAAYRRQRGQWRRFVTPLEHVGDGGIFASVDDLARWDAHFYAPSLGKDADLVKRQRQVGPHDDYAFGLIRTTFRGHAVEMHGGAFVGYRSDLVRFPDLGLSFVCLGNHSSFIPTQFALALAKAAGVEFKDESPSDVKPDASEKTPAGKSEPLPLPESLAQGARGLWTCAEFECPCRVAIRNGSLYLYFARNPITLSHESGPSFGGDEFRVTFRTNDQGRPTEMLLQPDGGPPHVYRAPKPKAD